MGRKRLIRHANSVVEQGHLSVPRSETLRRSSREVTGYLPPAKRSARAEPGRTGAVSNEFAPWGSRLQP
jgi:hypothetical protein